MKQRLSVFITVLLGISVIMACNDSSMSKKQQRALKGLRISVKALNKSLPKQVDSLTRLDSVSFDGHDYVYNYTLLNDISADELQSRLSDKLNKSVCQRNSYNMFPDLDIVVSYRYLDSDGTLVKEFSYKTSECD